MIYHLIKKDFRRLWSVIIAFFALGIIMCAAVFGEDYFEEGDYINATEMVLAGLLLHMLVFGNLMNVEKYEEKHNGYRMMAPLPVSSYELVVAKYITIFLNAVFGIVSIYVIYELFGVGDAWPGLKIRYLLVTGALTLVLNGISDVGVFRYGFHKVRMGIMVVYILALLGPQLITFLQQVRDTRFFLLAISEMSISAILGCAAAAVGIFAACLYASVRVRESREI